MIVDLLNNTITQEELLNNYNANISEKILPKYIHGFVFNYKGINNIIINKNLSYYIKGNTLIHEIAHLELNQIGQNDKDLLAFKINDYEDDADKYINFIEKSFENKI